MRRAAGRRDDHSDDRRRHGLPAQPGHRNAVHQHDPHAVDRRGAGGQLGSSGHADGARAAGVRAVESRDALRSRRSDLAQPRSLRAVQRPRVDAAVVAAASHRREGGQSRSTKCWAATRSRSTTSGTSARSAARRPAIPSTTSCPAWRRRPGPLGQGIATSVGMAIAQKWLAARYNQPDFPIFDYNIYAICGDGCLMEGIGSEAASLAGHLELDNLCWIYDNNHITIEGNTRIAFTEDVAARFLGYQLERAARRRRQRPRAHRARAARVQADEAPADAHHPRHAHRLRLAAPAGHGGRARRAARRGGGEAHQARVRLAGGRAVPGARRRASSTSRRHRRARREGARRVERALRASIARSIPRSPTEIEQMQKRELPDGLGPQPAGVPAPTRRASPAATRRARC